MAKRKRERGDIELMEGAKHKKVKEHVEDVSEASKLQGPAVLSPQVSRDVPITPETDLSNKAFRRQEIRREKRRRKSERAGAPTDEDQGTSQPVETINKALESASSVLVADSVNTAFRQQEAEQEKRERKRNRRDGQAEVAVAESRESSQPVSLVVEALESIRPVAGLDSVNKAFRRQEARREKRRKNKQQKGNHIAADEEALQRVIPAIEAVESTLPALDEDHSTKALRRQERKQGKKKKEREKIGSLMGNGQAGLHTDSTIAEPLKHTGTTLDTDPFTTSLTRPAKRQRRGEIHKDKPSAWKVSEASGGQMLDLDPLFSQNEEHLLLAYKSAIHVYSTSTSILVRKLQTSRTDKITAFTFSSINQSHLFVSTRSGVIEKWDWTKGLKVEYWNTSSPTHSLVAPKSTADDESNGLVYTIDSKGESLWMITAHRLIGGTDAAKTDLGTLWKYTQPLTSLKIFDNGRVIVATSGSYLMVGTTEKPNATPLREVSYSWREVECPEWITSIDVQVKYPNQPSKKTKLPHPTSQAAVNIVLGGLKGAIFVYYDLLKKIKEAERRLLSDKGSNIISHRKHWHRNAVLSVKWSVDGNYIVSGGLETVLQIWQLETGQTQSLPHLSAPIESIVVSPSGSSYAVRLADNSAMILSTSELQPTFSVSGIQIPTARNADSALPHLPTVDAPTRSFLPIQSLQFPAAVGSKGPDQLLLAVPSSTSSRQILTSKQSAVFLQTFSSASSQQLSRQALTRTNVTDVSIGPESNVIEEPTVTFMQTSSDGQWLATVDEWMPPKRDLAFLAFDKEKAVDEQNFRLEIYLKFWLWNDETKSWELVSRIDNPHASQSDNHSGHGVIEDLVSDPSSIGFSTIGDDGNVRIWKPSVRSRNGLEVRGKDGQRLTSWKCRQVTALQAPESAAVTNNGAKIAYSPDGSMLAVGFQSSPSCTIHIIDADNGSSQWTKTHMFHGPLLGLGITSKYLITLSDELRVFDLVNSDLTFGFSLYQYGFSLRQKTEMTHLAVDHQNSTFAIALPETKHPKDGIKKPKVQIIVFDPAKCEPLFSTSLPNPIISLLPTKGQKRYYAIDSVAEIRTLTPSRSLPVDLLEASNTSQAPPRGLQDIYGNGTSKADHTSDDDAEPATPKLSSSNVTLRLPEEDAVVVSQDQLAEIFDVGNGHALPPVTELFEQVASLFAGKN